jgi:hypothetical protein
VTVCPEESGDILDIDEATLVILHPKVAHTKNDKDSDALAFAQKATETRGTANRVNRNMVVYVAADAVRLQELDTAVRQYLGWKDVLDHAAELDLTPTQKQQAQDQATRNSDTAESRLLGTYQWLLVPTQADPAAPFNITATKAEGQTISLAERASKKLGTEGQLTSQLGPATIRFALDNKVPAAWETGHIKVGELWQLFARYPYMTRLRERPVLDHGLIQPQSLVWQHDGFALADGYDDTTSRYRGLVLPTDNQNITVTNETLVVKPAVAQEQREREEADAGEREKEREGRDDEGQKEDGERIPIPPAPPAKTRFFGSKTLNSDRYGLDFKRLADEVLAHLATTPGIQLEIRVEIEALAPDGFDDTKLRTINENANTLKFDSTEFE